jgi:hypothetical protein
MYLAIQSYPRVATLAQRHLHWRFPFDPPEAQTIAVRVRDPAGPDKTDGTVESVWPHLAMYRKEPAKSRLACVAGTLGEFHLSTMGAAGPALLSWIESTCMRKGERRQTANNGGGSSSSSASGLAQARQDALVKMRDQVGDAAPAVRNKRMRLHSKMERHVTTLNRVGIFTDVDSNDIGYRPPPLTDAAFMRALGRVAAGGDGAARAIEEIDDVLNSVDIGNDEADFGIGLHVGSNLWCSRSKYADGNAARVLKTAYELLGWNLFARVVAWTTGKRDNIHVYTGKF